MGLETNDILQDRKIWIPLSKYTSKTIRNVKNSFISQTAKQDTYYSLLVANFAHASEVVDNAQ